MVFSLAVKRHNAGLLYGETTERWRQENHFIFMFISHYFFPAQTDKNESNYKKHNHIKLLTCYHHYSHNFMAKFKITSQRWYKK